jgi:serine-protein kinase ATM
MATLNLHDVCNKLTSNQVRSRQTALSDLQRFLNQDDAYFRLLDETTYGGVLHALIRNFTLEAANFRKSGSAQATSLLNISAECFKTSAEKARSLITRSTMKMIVNHVLDCIPTSDVPEYKVVAPSFFATLRLITSHPAHVEQMKKEMWMALVQLCVVHVEVSNWFDLQNPLREAMHTDEDDIASFKTLPMRKEIVDLMFCLQSLCLFPGAPFQGGEESLLSFLLNFLTTYDTVSDARMSAIIALNRILEHVAVNKMELASKVSFMVLELVCRVWNTRISGFKERLLISLSMVYPHLYHAALQNGLGLQARRNVDKLVEKFTFDLRGQEQKGGLQLEDLVLSSLPSSSPLWRHRPFQSLLGPYFSLNPRSQSSELAWLTLQTKSCFIQLLDLVPCEATQDSPNESDSPRKRRRLLPNLSLRHLLDDIIQHKGQQSGVLISLQTLAFYLNSFQPPSDSLELSEVLFQLEKIGDENKSDIVSWTFICVLCVLGRLGKTPATSLSPISSEQWTRIWISCSKQAALSATCRAACAVMDAIVSNNVLHVRSLIPHVKAVIEYVEQRGPGYFGDSSCDFWNSLLRGLEEAGVTTEAWRHKALTRWVRFRWDVNEKGDLSSQGKRYQLLTFPCLSLFAPTKWGINRQLDFRYLQSLPKSHLAQSLYNSSTQKPLINFLLDSQIDPSHGPADMNQQSIPSTLTSEIDLDDILAEKCQEAFARLRPSEERDPISTEDLGWYTSLAMIAILLLRKPIGWKLLNSLASQDTRSVFTAIIDYISSSSEKLLSVDSCLRAISQCTCPAETSFGNQEVMDPVLQEAASSIYATMPFREFVDDLCRLSGKLEAQGKDNYADIEFTGLQKHVISSPSSLDASWAVRDISKWFMTTEGWRMRLLTRLQTDAHMHHGLTAYRLGEKYFRDLPILNILLAGDQVSRTVFSTCGGESSSVAEALLETFKNDVASTYEWGGNEMTAFAAMALVSAFFSSAKTANPSNVPNLITQLYSWVVKVVIIRDISSVHARLRASQLLRQISKIDVQYGKDTKSETRVGTLLIKMMQHQDMRIQFSLADHIKSTFLCFSFADRIPVYRDIVDNLELDETNIEGFLLRAYTLMQLALTSDDIRRAAMVNLLELGNTESCIFAVHACFRQIADRLYHGQLAELFSENSTQFVHSWIEFEQDIFQFPFQLFGFPNFESWGLSVQSDLISQLVNAGRWEDAMNVFRQSDRFEDLLVRFLPQIISYAYLRGSGESDGGGDVSDRCQAALGFDNYISVLRSRFASSLALIVEKFDDKSLSRESFESVGLSSASDIFSVINIQPLGPSYPDPPEPAFNFRKVIAAIENLRQDLNISSQLLWSPPITIFVIRHLMDRGVCASDTTVALSFLRRIVLVLCIAGKTVYEGYTLEMLLFGLKDFITRDALCREAIQVIKYLFSISKPYAIAHPVRLRQTVHVLLPAIWRLRSASSDSHCYDVVRDTYSWLDNMVTNGFQAHEDLLATTRLLQILSGNQEKQESSAGQIVEQVILEDETLWSEPKLSHFGLQLLSNVSQVFLEPLATLRRLVTHFMTPNCTHIYSSEEKLWLGLALGRISRETPFCKPEYKSVQERMGDQSHGDGSVSSTVAVLREIFRFMHSERRTSGLLEQALGALTSDSKLNSRNFGANQYVLKYLKSPYVPVGSPVRSWNFPPPSDVLVWTDFKQDFATWHKALACSIAQHLPIQLFATLVPAIDASIGFCQAVFPYLVDECRSQRPYDGSLAKIFNTVLQASFDIDLEYSRLVIRTILFLRERPSVILKNNGEPLVHEISYLDAAHAAVACKMYKTGLMFLEIYEKKVSASSDPFPDEILSKIYRNIDDPDLTYALSQGVSRSWSQLLDVYQLHHDRGGVSGLRRARLRAKIELGTNPTGDDDDLLAVADLVRQTGFPLNSVDILGGASHGNQEHTPTASVYKSAWRLGNWDLPPLMRSNNPDSLIYSVLYQLTQKSMSDEFFTVLHSAIIQLADNVAIGPSSPEITNAVSCLSMFTDLRELFSTSKSVITAGRNWATQILRHAEYGR